MNDPLRQRLESLTASQRVELAKLLGCEAESRQKLVACVTRRPGQSAIATDDVKRSLGKRLPETMIPAAIIELESLPRLANGKTDTRALADMALPTPPVSQSRSDSTPASDAQAILHEVWVEVLGMGDVHVDDNFFEIGGDSIMSIRIVARSRELGVSISPQDLMAHQTIAELATVAKMDAPTTSTAEEDAIGTLPLTPIQHWFFELGLVCPEHWNQIILVNIPPDVQVEELRRSIGVIVAQHEELRARFNNSDGGWQQEITPLDDAPQVALEVIELAEDAVEDHLPHLQTQVQLDRSNDTPLAHFTLYREGTTTHTLAMVLHHLVIDNVSWRILLEDLKTAYERADLPTKSTSYKRWAEHLMAKANSDAVARELDYWTAPVSGELASIPADHQFDAPLTESHSEIVRVSLGTEQTGHLLREANNAFNTRAHDLLVTALTQTLLAWAGGDGLRLGLEGFGRESSDETIDVSRTVGWFTAFYTITLQLAQSTGADDDDGDGDAIKSVKEQLRAVPNGGIGYGLLRYLASDKGARQAIEAMPREEVLFNYMGTLPTPDRESPGLVRSMRAVAAHARAPENQRSHLLEINAYIEDGVLQLLWTFNSLAHNRKSIENLASRYLETLTQLISHCLGISTAGYTPSDFPDADLDQEGLDRFLDSIG